MTFFDIRSAETFLMIFLTQSVIFRFGTQFLNPELKAGFLNSRKATHNFGSLVIYIFKNIFFEMKPSEDFFVLFINLKIFLVEEEARLRRFVINVAMI